LAAARGVEAGELPVGERPRLELQTVLTARGKLNVAVVERGRRLGGSAEACRPAGDARVASFDLSLSDPKSVSLLAAGSPRKSARNSKQRGMPPSAWYWVGWGCSLWQWEGGLVVGLAVEHAGVPAEDLVAEPLEGDQVDGAAEWALP
jgi:hypothetical protein